jgi:hypothetical protein
LPDLKTDKTLWEKSLLGGCDRMSMTADGTRLYVPSFEGPHWNVVDGTNGDVIAKVKQKAARTTPVCSLDGSRVYMAGLRSPLLTVLDAKTQKMVGQIGPFGSTIRPFAVNGPKTLCVVNVNGPLGFEIGDLTTGQETLSLNRPRRSDSTKRPMVGGYIDRHQSLQPTLD